MFIRFLCFCPLRLAIMLNFNISKVAYSKRGICPAFVILSVPSVGICHNTSARGWGICQFFLKWLTLFLFQYFIKKYAYLDSFSYLCKEYF